MLDHHEEVEASAPHVPPPSMEYKQFILQQLVQHIEEETIKAKSSYGIMGQSSRNGRKILHG